MPQSIDYLPNKAKKIKDKPKNDETEEHKKDNQENNQIGERKETVEIKTDSLSLKQGKKNNFWGIFKKFKKNRDEKDEKENKSLEKKNDMDVDFAAADIIMTPEKELIKKLIILVVLIVGSMVMLSFIYLALIIKEKVSVSDIGELQNKLVEVNENIDKFKDSQVEIVRMGKIINATNSLLDNHIYWDKVFEIIEGQTLSEVNYVSLNISASGELKASAIATEFDVLAEQINILNSLTEYFKEVNVTSIKLNINKETGEKKGINFALSILLKPEIFYRKD